MRPFNRHGGKAMSGGLVLALCCTCGVSQTNPPTSALHRDGPVIVRVVSRDSQIIARAGQNGPIYEMQSRDGQVIVPAMTLPQLHAQHPEIARRVNTMMGADTATVWAGIDRD
jgi:hypothetical protein